MSTASDRTRLPTARPDDASSTTATATTRGEQVVAVRLADLGDDVQRIGGGVAGLTDQQA